MQNGNVRQLPFGPRAELELQTEWGSLTLLPVEPGQSPRLELSRGSSEGIAVHIEKVGEVVRVSLDPERYFNIFTGWSGECRAVLYVPRDVRASMQTNAGAVSVRGLEGCELGIKANAGKIELENVYGLMHLAAHAGSIAGRGLGGYFDVEAHAGSVRLEILDLQPGEHRIRASMGSVRLALARGIDLCIETHAALGSVRNSYPVRQEAPVRLVLSTEMGSVRVEESTTYRATRRATPPPSTQDRPSQPDGSKSPREDPELDRILKMVEAGELSAQDANELLQAMGRV
jgi:hypothetical protein